MHEWIWFVAGCVTTAVGSLVWLHIARRSRATGLSTVQGPALPEPEELAAPEPATPNDVDPIAATEPVDDPAPTAVEPEPEVVELEAEPFARQIAAELATLASGVEGHAQLLIECVGQPRDVPHRAERLWTAVRRLRMLQRKLRSLGRLLPLEVQPTNIAQLLVGVRADLQQLGAGVKPELHIAPTLPLAAADGEALHDAVIFLFGALLGLEAGTGALSMSARTRVAEEHEPVIEIEIAVDWDEEGDAARLSDISFDYLAARNLLDAQGAHLALCHVPGMHASALVTLPAMARSDAEPAPEPIAEGPPHQFGGVLVLERDPSIRSMMAAELRAAGRNILACGDGAAARSLLKATPERFELLILDPERDDRLLTSALDLCSQVKILCVQAGDQGRAALPRGLEGRAHQLHKPFGINDLRRVLGEVFAPTSSG